MSKSQRTAELEKPKWSPYAFTVGEPPNQKLIFDPHPGVQLETVRKLSRRVRTGEGPSKFFLRGNRGGGKSFMMRQLLHALALAMPGFKYVVVRRAFPDLESNHLIYLSGEMGKFSGYYHETKKIAYYENGSMGFYRQCAEFADVEKIVGAEAAALFVDEAPQIEWDYLTLMLPSLRVPKRADGTQPFYVMAVFGGNPTGASIDDLDRRFIEKDIKPHESRNYDPHDWEHIPVFLKDNPSLDPQEYLKQLGDIPPAFQSAWIDGVRMEARTLFRIHPEKDGKPYHYIQELPTIDGVPLLKVPWIQVYRGFDMGFFPDPAACVWLVVVGRRIFAVCEGTWFETIASDLAAKLLEQTRELVGTTPVTNTLVDPQIAIKSGVDVTVMDTLEMHGVSCQASVNDRVLYADAIHGLLGEEVEPGVPRFQIYVPGCPMLAKYLPKMQWDEHNPRKMADHKMDHWVVALAYFAISSGVLAFAAAETTAQEPVWMSWMREASAGRRGRARA